MIHTEQQSFILTISQIKIKLGTNNIKWELENMIKFENKNVPTKEDFQISEIDERVVVRKPNK